MENDFAVPEFKWGKKVMPRDLYPEEVQIETDEDEVNFIHIEPELRTTHLKQKLQEEQHSSDRGFLHSLLARHRWKKIGNELVDTYDLSTLESEDEQLGHAQLRSNRQQIIDVTSKIQQVQGEIQSRPNKEELIEQHDVLVDQLEYLLQERDVAIKNVDTQYRKLLSPEYHIANVLPHDPMFKHIVKRKRRPAHTLRSLEREVVAQELSRPREAGRQLKIVGPALALAGVSVGWLAPHAFKSFTKSVKRILIGTAITAAAMVVLQRKSDRPAPTKHSSSTDDFIDVNLLHLDSILDAPRESASVMAPASTASVSPAPEPVVKRSAPTVKITTPTVTASTPLPTPPPPKPAAPKPEPPVQQKPAAKPAPKAAPPVSSSGSDDSSYESDEDTDSY